MHEKLKKNSALVVGSETHQRVQSCLSAQKCLHSNKKTVIFYLIQVHEKATNDLIDCKFPFVYNGKAYYGCTDTKLYGVPDNQIWCSTKTNSSTYEHIDWSQHWGICPDSNCVKPKCTTKIGNFPINIEGI